MSNLYSNWEYGLVHETKNQKICIDGKITILKNDHNFSKTSKNFKTAKKFHECSKSSKNSRIVGHPARVILGASYFSQNPSFSHVEADLRY